MIDKNPQPRPPNPWKVLEFPGVFGDLGGLVPFEFESMPFAPKRVFIVRDVFPGTVRGRHAHLKCEQLLVAVAGTVLVELFGGGLRGRVTLDRPDIALQIPARIWAHQQYVAPNSVLMVFASEPYEESDYIEDYDVFVKTIETGSNGTPEQAGVI